MTPGVLDHIVPHGLCVGCGMCAGLLPTRLEMQLDEYGAYLPVKKNADLNPIEQALSLRVCPFSDQQHNEDTIAVTLYGQLANIKHRSETGYYLECFAGHVTDEKTRLASSSGGLITRLLRDLLTSGTVDAVACVGQSDTADALFNYQIIENADDLARCRKSKYYPVEVSAVIPRIRNYTGRVCFVGLPCFVKAIRLAMLEDAALRERIIYTVGLFCGHLKTRQYLYYLSRCCGVHEDDIITTDFRKKVAGRPAIQYAFEVITKEHGREVRREIPMKNVFASNWSLTAFMHAACDWCDDVLAETADVAVGDAWLPEFTNDYRGTSLVICRRPDLLKMLMAGAERSELAIKPLPVEDIIRSQVGGLRHRRQGLSYRLYLAQNRGQRTPRKRVPPERNALPLFGRVIQRLRLRIKDLSREAFLQQQRTTGINHFVAQMRPWVLLHNSLYRTRQILAGIRRRLTGHGN